MLGVDTFSANDIPHVMVRRGAALARQKIKRSKGLVSENTSRPSDDSRITYSSFLVGRNFQRNPGKLGLASLDLGWSKPRTGRFKF